MPPSNTLASTSYYSRVTSGISMSGNNGCTKRWTAGMVPTVGKIKA